MLKTAISGVTNPSRSLGQPQDCQPALHVGFAAQIELRRERKKYRRELMPEDERLDFTAGLSGTTAVPKASGRTGIQPRPRRWTAATDARPSRP